MFLFSLLFVCSPPSEILLPRVEITPEHYRTPNTYFSLYVEPTISSAGLIQLSTIGLDPRCFVSYPNHILFPDLCILPPHCPAAKYIDTTHSFFSTGLRICYSLSVSPGPVVPLYSLDYPSEVYVNEFPSTFQGRLEYQSVVQPSSYLFSYAGRNFSIPTYCLQFYPTAPDGLNWIYPPVEITANHSTAFIRRSTFCLLERLLSLRTLNISALANFKSSAGASFIPRWYPVHLLDRAPLHPYSGCDFFPTASGRSNRLRICDYYTGLCYPNSTSISLSRDSISITKHSFFTNLFNVISSYFLYPLKFLWHHIFLVFHSFYIYIILSIRYLLFASIIFLFDSVSLAVACTLLLLYYDNVWYQNFLNYQDPAVFLDNLQL